MGEQIEFQAGTETIAGYLAVPAAGAGPGVLVLHAWWGLTPSFTAVCDRLAEAGFVAVAPDLHAGQTATTIAEAEVLLATRSAGHAAAQSEQPMHFSSPFSWRQSRCRPRKRG